MLTEKIFNEEFTALEIIFEVKKQNKLKKLYYKALKNLSDDQYKRTIAKCIEEIKYFPKIAEIREKAGENKDKALEAWLMVEKAMEEVGLYESVKFPDLVIHSAINAMGGWVNMNMHDVDNIKWTKRDFIELYRHLEHKEDYPEYLPGLIEQKNYAKGYGHSQPILIGHKEKKALPKPKQELNQKPEIFIPKGKVIELCQRLQKAVENRGFEKRIEKATEQTKING